VASRFDDISPELRTFLEAQPVFFVATAPLAADGHVNVSPKGLDTFRVVGPRQVMYLDLTGSGNETAAHVTENARLTLMFCAFSGRPQIVRLYCRGRALVRGDAGWENAIARFPPQQGVRQVIVGDVELVQTSCGYAVPLMAFDRARDQLVRWAESKGPDGLVEYRRTRNARSVDGLPTPVTDRPAPKA
jgi:hypothetical protein